MQKAIFIVEKTSDGYSAYCEFGYQGVAATTGSNITELKANALEAYNAFLFAINKKPVTETAIGLRFDLKQFFEYYNISGTTVAKKAGINRALLSQYVNEAKQPSAKQLNKIQAAIHDLGRELLSVELI